MRTEQFWLPVPPALQLWGSDPQPGLLTFPKLPEGEPPFPEPQNGLFSRCECGSADF